MKKKALYFAVSLSLAGTAQAGDLRADPLLAVDMNRAAIVNRIVTDWAGALSPGQEKALRETLHALRRFAVVAVAGFLVNEASYAALLQETTIDYRIALWLVLGAVAVLTWVAARDWAFAGR